MGMASAGTLAAAVEEGAERLAAAGVDNPGGDARMLRDLFVGGEPDPLGRAADHLAGVAAISVGIAANVSFETGLPVRVRELLAGGTWLQRWVRPWALASAVVAVVATLVARLLIQVQVRYR